MPDAMQLVETINGFVPSSEVSIAELCRWLVVCEKMQHRYQWTSGALLVALLQRPEAPQKLPDFVHWLTERTGLVLTQSEVSRRVAVYQFYSKFEDHQIIDLVEHSGVQIAYRARRVITHDEPEQARSVLEACVQNPGALDQTLREFGEKRNRAGKRPAIKLAQKTVSAFEEKVRSSVSRFEDQDWVPLTVVQELIHTLRSGDVDGERSNGG
jgi:hypothetical protein